MANGNLSLGGLEPTPSGQTRIRLARSLMGQGASGEPVQSVTQGLNRLAQGFLGGRLANIQRQEEQQRQQRLAETLRGAVQAGQPFEDQIEPGTGQRVAPARQRIAEVLMGNPDTAAVGANVALARQLQGSQDTPARVRELEAAGLTPGTPEFRDALLQSRGVETGQGDRIRTLSPEQAREAGFPEGAVVQQKPGGEFTVKFDPSGRGGDQRDREIADLSSDLEAQGVSNPRQKATRIVDGRARIEVSEDGTRAVFVDEVALAAGEEDAVTELQLREPREPERAEVEPADSLFALADKATGPGPAFRSLTARIPFTNVSEAERESVSAQRAFELTENELARGLVNNPRFPVREREAVINAINISPSVFDNPDAMKARLSAARDFLQTRLEQAERDAQDETLPGETRQAQSANASAMRNALDRIGQPGEETASTISQIANLDAENARFVVDDTPPAQLRTMINNASNEELENLSPELRARIRDRLTGGQ